MTDQPKWHTYGLGKEIREQGERERRRSPHRDRWSRERVHQVDWDINKAIGFVIDRRRSYPGAMDIARRAQRGYRDLPALLDLVKVIRSGTHSGAMYRRCARITANVRLVATAWIVGDQNRRNLHGQRNNDKTRPPS